MMNKTNKVTPKATICSYHNVRLMGYNGTTEKVVHTCIIPGGSFGPNGAMEIVANLTNGGGSITKTYNMYFNGIRVGQFSSNSTSQGPLIQRVIWTPGREDKLVTRSGNGGAAYSALVSTTLDTIDVDTRNDITVTITIAHSSATTSYLVTLWATVYRNDADLANAFFNNYREGYLTPQFIKPLVIDTEAKSFTGNATTTTVRNNYLIPGGAVGPYGILECMSYWEISSNATQKTAYHVMGHWPGSGAGVIVGALAGTTHVSIGLQSFIANKGSEAKQDRITTSGTNASWYTTTSVVQSTSDVDTSRDWYFTSQANTGASGQTMIQRLVLIVPYKP